LMIVSLVSRPWARILFTLVSTQFISGLLWELHSLCRCLCWEVENYHCCKNCCVWWHVTDWRFFLINSRDTFGEFFPLHLNMLGSFFYILFS
jgi:hypothetical protein